MTTTVTMTQTEASSHVRLVLQRAPWTSLFRLMRDSHLFAGWDEIERDFSTLQADKDRADALGWLYATQIVPKDSVLMLPFAIELQKVLQLLLPEGTPVAPFLKKHIAYEQEKRVIAAAERQLSQQREMANAALLELEGPANELQREVFGRMERQIETAQRLDDLHGQLATEAEQFADRLATADAGTEQLRIQFNQLDLEQSRLKDV